MMNKSVMILALGDIYWTRFARLFSKQLSDAGIHCVIVLESRAGEYQSFLGRCEYPGASVHYLTDYINTHDPVSESENDYAVMCDYLRVEMLGQFSKLNNTNWNHVASYINDFTAYVMKSENIGLMIGDQVSTSLSYNFCEAAKLASVEYWGLAGSRLAGRHVVATTVKEENITVETLYNEIVSNEKPVTPEEKAWSEQYLKDIDAQIPDYMRSKKLNSVTLGKFFNKTILKNIAGTLLYTVFERTDKKAIVIKATPLVSIYTASVRNITRWFKSRIIRKYFVDSVEQAINKSHYYVFPIHYQPEASTVVASPYHCDQLNLIKNLAFSLPSGTKLVVKEHVSNVGFPSVGFYKAVRSLPNVVLVWHDQNIKELIRHSEGVITLTSTAGFEALLLNKQAFHYGDVFYTYHPNAKKLDAWGSINDVFQEPLSNKYDNVAFLVAYRRYTHEGRLNFENEDFNISGILLSKVKKCMFDMKHVGF